MAEFVIRMGLRGHVYHDGTQMIVINEDEPGRVPAGDVERLEGEGIIGDKDLPREALVAARRAAAAEEASDAPRRRPPVAERRERRTSRAAAAIRGARAGTGTRTKAAAGGTSKRATRSKAAKPAPASATDTGGDAPAE
jgi:hypothetical protein